VTFLILLLDAGVRATPSILIVPLEKEFGWSVAAISAAVAVNIFLYGIIGPFAAFFSSGLLCIVAAVLASFIGSGPKQNLVALPVLETR
jgi:hypothetical protein